MTRPGMVPQKEWAKSEVHKASRYFCAKCGREFKSPAVLYDHIEKEHGDGDE